MWVKICGITREVDAQLAARFGADAIGIVFWPGSPRYVDPMAARGIVSGLPPSITAVGVFVNQPVEHVEAVARTVGLGAVQLHGTESAEYCARLTPPVIKAVATDPGSCALTIAALPAGVTVLLDVHDPVVRGGTGRMADWDTAAAVAKSRRIILAGGLSPDNVAEAIRVVRPYGVDASSRIEARPGVKDEDRLRGFLEAVRACAAEG